VVERRDGEDSRRVSSVVQHPEAPRARLGWAGGGEAEKQR